MADSAFAALQDRIRAAHAAKQPLVIRGGGTEVPNTKTGLLNVYGQVWRLGGTEGMTGDQMDEFLEARAASVSKH